VCVCARARARVCVCYRKGADIENVCREASMFALRRDLSRCVVTQEDFEKAIKTRRPSVSKSELQEHAKLFVASPC